MPPFFNAYLQAKFHRPLGLQNRVMSSLVGAPIRGGASSSRRKGQPRRNLMCRFAAEWWRLAGTPGGL